MAALNAAACSAGVNPGTLAFGTLRDGLGGVKSICSSLSASFSSEALDRNHARPDAVTRCAGSQAGSKPRVTAHEA